MSLSQEATVSAVTHRTALHHISPLPDVLTHSVCRLAPVLVLQLQSLEAEGGRDGVREPALFTVYPLQWIT